MKMIGILLICSSALAAAAKVVKARGDTLRALRALGRMLELMEGELATRRSPIPALAAYLKDKSEGAASAFLAALSEKTDRLGKESFSEIWAESLRETVRLKGTELQSLQQLGRILGQVDLETQLEAIRQCREQLRSCAEAIERDHRQNCRTCYAVALLSAAMLCIVLL